MIAIQPHFLSEQERQDLRVVVRRNYEKSQITRHANIILLLDMGKKVKEIADFLFLDDSTIYHIYSGFMENRLAIFRMKPSTGRPLKLDKTQMHEISTHLATARYATSQQVQDYISTNFAIKLSKSAILVLLHRLKFAYRKIKILPPSASDNEQEALIKSYNQLKETVPDDEIIVHIDAVHPTHMAKSGFVWAPCDDKLAILSNDGRKRLNIHGAINLENGEFTFMENLTVNAETTLQLLKKLMNKYENKNKIHIYWDNAKYHYSKVVQEFIAAENGRLVIHKLPAYCPHLNPIERLWHEMHKYVTRNRYYKTYNEFCEAILTFFRKTLPDKWHKISSYVTDNFRVTNTNGYKLV